MNNVVMYTSEHCPFCKQADALLTRRGVTTITKINIDGNAELREKMITLTQRRTVPQIFFGDTHVGGFDDLARLDRSGQLDTLLRRA